MSKKIITLTLPNCVITQHSRAANQLNVEGDSMELPLARTPSTGGMVINNAASTPRNLEFTVGRQYNAV
jgi:hypothetical protein